MTATVLQFPRKPIPVPAVSVMAFAQTHANQYKPWQKMWMLLDSTGKPIRLLTPEEAGAAKRSGSSTTWVKNLWGVT